MRSRLGLVALFLPVVLHPSDSLAQWALDGTVVSSAVNTQWDQVIVADGAGGAIMAWGDARPGTNYDIYAQRINASGVPQWIADGVPVCTHAADQQFAAIASDGAGGVIVVWHDFRNGFLADIYAQRLNSAGVPQWTANGVPICTAPDDQRVSMIVSDGAGGAIAMWADRRNGASYDIYAQRVNASGVTQWAANGVVVCNAALDQQDPQLVSDGAGGAIAAWFEGRNWPNYDIFAQRVNASGVPQWAANGIAICDDPSHQSTQTIAPDAVGGAIISWTDFRYGSGDIFAQHVNTLGTAQWTANGIAISSATGNQGTPAITADGAGGAVIAWDDNRSGSSADVYAQRVSGSGSPQWATDGVALSTAFSDQLRPRIASDGAGGAVVTWYDNRSGAYDIYAQRVSAYGTPLWAYDGAAVSTAPGYQNWPDIVADGAGGMIVGWVDNRAFSDIYAQRMENRFGYWGHPEPTVTSVADVRQDQGGKVAVNWTASNRDLPNPRTIDHYTIWRAVNTLPLDALTGSVVALSDLADIRADHTGPAYVPLTTSEYYWELVGTQSAHGWAGYSFSAPTRADSVLGDTANEVFMVAAHALYDSYVAFASNAVTGYSVDNLAPAAPLMLTAQRVGSDVQLEWNRAVAPDLRDYSVYRATSTGVTPVPINFLASSEDTVAVDSSAPTSALYYIVTALDVHANQSAPSNEASVGATTSVGNTPPISALTVLDNMPNPFTGTTTLRVGLPKASEVEIEVFDVAGRSVRSERTNLLAAGWREVSFEARDAAGISLPSGVYFYRVRAAGEMLTRKMVITR